jgi:hypothetical protein
VGRATAVPLGGPEVVTVGGGDVVPVGGSAVVLATELVVGAADGRTVGSFCRLGGGAAPVVAGTVVAWIVVTGAVVTEAPGLGTPPSSGGRVVVATPVPVAVEVACPFVVLTVGREVVLACRGLVVVVGRRAVVTVAATAVGPPGELAGKTVTVVAYVVAVVATLAASGIPWTSLVWGAVAAAACAARTPPAVNAAAPTATWAPLTRACPAMPSRATNGTSATHETGPIIQRTFPIETLRNALTITGSNWLPAQRVNSVRAATGLIAFL